MRFSYKVWSISAILENNFSSFISYCQHSYRAKPAKKKKTDSIMKKFGDLHCFISFIGWYKGTVVAFVQENDTAEIEFEKEKGKTYF